MSLKKNDEKINIYQGPARNRATAADFFFFFPVVFVETLTLIHVDKLPLELDLEQKNRT